MARVPSAFNFVVVIIVSFLLTITIHFWLFPNEGLYDGDPIRCDPECHFISSSKDTLQIKSIKNWDKKNRNGE